MKSSALILVALLLFANSYGQTATNTYGKIDVEITKSSRKKINAKVDIKSSFPGGDSSWVQSLENTLNQSTQLAKGAKKGTYVVSVQFIVDKSGAVSDLKPLTSNGYGMETEVLRALKKKPMWLPSPQGRPVRPYRTSSTSPPAGN